MKKSTLFIGLGAFFSIISFCFIAQADLGTASSQTLAKQLQRLKSVEYDENTGNFYAAGHGLMVNKSLEERYQIIKEIEQYQVH